MTFDSCSIHIFKSSDHTFVYTIILFGDVFPLVLGMISPDSASFGDDFSGIVLRGMIFPLVLGMISPDSASFGDNFIWGCFPTSFGDDFTLVLGMMCPKVLVLGMIFH